MLGNFRTKQNLYFMFSAPSLSKIRSRATKGGREANIYRRYKQIQQFKKIGILLAI